jgi:hypothetical protein
MIDTDDHCAHHRRIRSVTTDTPTVCRRAHNTGERGGPDPALRGPLHRQTANAACRSGEKSRRCCLMTSGFRNTLRSRSSTRSVCALSFAITSAVERDQRGVPTPSRLPPCLPGITWRPVSSHDRPGAAGGTPANGPWTATGRVELVRYADVADDRAVLVKALAFVQLRLAERPRGRAAVLRRAARPPGLAPARPTARSHRRRRTLSRADPGGSPPSISHWPPPISRRWSGPRTRRTSPRPYRSKAYPGNADVEPPVELGGRGQRAVVGRLRSEHIR